MKLLKGLLLPALIGAASATSEAKVYILQGKEWPNTSNPPTLSPEQARLVLAQRLGVSQYHNLGDSSESTLSYINTFGGSRESLFQDAAKDKAAELVLIVEGVSYKSGQPLFALLDAWSSMKPAFSISNPPSASSNLELARDLQKQTGTSVPKCAFEDTINPFDIKCWNGREKIMQIDLQDKSSPKIEDLMLAQERLTTFAKNEEMNVVVILMPESSRHAKNTYKPYGTYDSPSQAPLGRRQVEEPMTEQAASASPISQWKQVKASNSSDPEPLTGVPPRCYTSLDACTKETRSCSGHGKCYRRSGPREDDDVSPSCFACKCESTTEEFLEGEAKTPAIRTTYWGGAACQKKDVSGPFWLFAIFTVVMVGLVSWAIGMLFSIGEEKLPGVIGAGVSSKAR